MARIFGEVLQQLIVAALDTGMRAGELLKLTFGDIDFDQQVIHVRAENAKSKKARVIPVNTTRLRTLLDYLRIDADGQQRAACERVFIRDEGHPVKSFRKAWEVARERAGLPDVRFHNLRSEYASRLLERGVPLSQVRALLGHCSVLVTERYDRQTLDTLRGAVGRLDDGESFKILSRSQASPAPVESTSLTH